MKRVSNRLPRETEAEFQTKVLGLARVMGWRSAHFRPGRTAQGWRTAVQGDGKGFPDLVLVRDRILFVELKRDGEKPTAEQAAWIAAVRAAGGEAHVWRPSDWNSIVEVLRR